MSLESIGLLEIETSLGYPKKLIAGVDEVGRGCLAGPVVAAAVILPKRINLLENPWLEKVNDSKLLDPKVRQELVPFIRKWSFAYSIGVASVDEVDDLNILHASHLAMVRAVQDLFEKPDHVIADGKFIPKAMGVPVTPVIKGDSLSLSVASASILAKVWRDQKMEELDREYPGYGFSSNKGYPTREHLKGLSIRGITPIHRRSFRPVANFLS